MNDKNLTWSNGLRKLGDLVPWSKNPRTLSRSQGDALNDSLNKFDLVELPAVNSDGTIIAGHQRVSLLLLKFGRDYEIEVRLPSRPLSEKEIEEYNIRSNANVGSWDYEILANSFDLDELLSWGMQKESLPFTVSDLEKITEGEGKGLGDLENKSVQEKFNLWIDQYRARLTGQAIKELKIIFSEALEIGK